MNPNPIETPLAPPAPPAPPDLLIPPSSGRCGPWVFYRRGRKQCRRAFVRPHNPRTPPQLSQRADFTRVAKAWRELTPDLRQTWNIAAALERSRPRLGLDGELTGQQFFQQINLPRLTIGKQLLFWPPDWIFFSPNPLCELSLANGRDGLRLKLRLCAPLEHDLMVFGQAPCSARRNKWRHGTYLDVLPAGTSGEIDITGWYVRQFGQAEPGTKVFIRTRQQRNGRESQNQDIAQVVPARVEARAGRRVAAGAGFFIVHSSFLIPRLRDYHRGARQPLRNHSLVHRFCLPRPRTAHCRELWRGT